jgi:GTP diphosphokinase / guanosine-3',5'-bis(diphosphate) 3'-diphosphatase
MASDVSALAHKVMSPQFLQALAFAAHKHRHQRRKDSEQTPYINHPITVANLLLNEAGITDEAVLIAALLHDTVEDTETTFEELEQHFGSLVRDLVAEVTDDRSLPKAVRKQRQIEHAAQLSDRAQLVKFADKIANLRDISNSPPAGWPSERLDAYLEWGKAVVMPLRAAHPRLAELFDQAYAQGKNAINPIKDN